MARWTFATVQITLDSVSAQAPIPLTPYQFTLPKDACAFWTWNARNGKCRAAILASRAPLRMSYIADIEDAEQFDPSSWTPWRRAWRKNWPCP